MSRSNQLGVWLYRRTSGRTGGGAGRVLVLTVPGRRTGQPRTTCIGYVDTPEGMLVWGSAAGAKHDPDWFRNLRAAGAAEVEIGKQHSRVVARELADAERDAAWTTILEKSPGVARYEKKADRTIPVALLTAAS
jgi:deazaflavin-dependent oxidoreductase (nitroreductase family)